MSDRRNPLGIPTPTPLGEAMSTLHEMWTEMIGGGFNRTDAALILSQFIAAAQGTAAATPCPHCGKRPGDPR